MAKLNTKPTSILTHEGAKAKRITPDMELRRTIMACMLFEQNFYESGQSVADRIKALVPQIEPGNVAAMAIEAREEQHLRHVPMLIAREMARYDGHKKYIREVLGKIIQRPDELCEFLAHYWADGRTPIAGQVKKGLADAFKKFGRYQLAKYDRSNAIKLRDVLFMVHAKPVDEKQEQLWKDLVNGNLGPADTWETKLSDTSDTRSKKEKWEDVIDLWITE